jgi:hypothetical protein
MIKVLTAVIVLSATAWPASLAAECLHYGAVSLTGRLVQQVYPGPPDFESVSSGDEPLVIWILQLDRSLCVISGNSSYSSTYNEREVQIVLGNEPHARTGRYAQYRHLLGQTITVTGRLLPGGGKYEKRFAIEAYLLKRGGQ